jgi:glycerophosphoryl diester phosphodiesterase
VQDITPEALRRAKNLDLVTAVWTVNTVEEIDCMIEYGVDAIVTDYPGRVQQRLAVYGYNWQ